MDRQKEDQMGGLFYRRGQQSRKGEYQSNFPAVEEEAEEINNTQKGTTFCFIANFAFIFFCSPYKTFTVSSNKTKKIIMILGYSTLMCV